MRIVIFIDNLVDKTVVSKLVLSGQAGPANYRQLWLG